MKVLLDECIPRKLKPLLSGHECRTAVEAGFAGKKNGELLDLAERDGFAVLLTLDRGIAHQQNLTGRSISVVVLGAKSSSLRDISPLLGTCLELLSILRPGSFHLVDR